MTLKVRSTLKKPVILLAAAAFYLILMGGNGWRKVSWPDFFRRAIKNIND